jgi:hypothetical protein
MKNARVIYLPFSLLVISLASLFTLATSSRAQSAPGAQSQEFQLVTPTGPVPPDYFGMHIHRASAPKERPGFIVTPWPQVPFHTWRLWDVQTTWRDLEPQKKAWHFQLLDQYVALAEQKHVEVLLTLGQTPAWASSRPTEHTYFPGTAAEPTSLNDWDDYIRTIATRYKGRIHAYEIWNEPNLPMFYSGSVQTLAEMSQRAVAIFRQVDPSITIVSPGITRDPQYLDRYIKAGGAKGVDVIGFHFYAHGQPEEVVPMAAKVKQVLASDGLGSLPIWNTESGWGDWKDGINTFTPDSAAAIVARANILLWASGVSRFYWYAWDNHAWVKLDLTEKDNTTETPAAQAYRTVEGWMLGNRFQGCQHSPNDIWTCTVNRSGHMERIVWAPSGDVVFTPPPSWKVTSKSTLAGQPSRLSSQTITIGPSPILLY